MSQNISVQIVDYSFNETLHDGEPGGYLQIFAIAPSEVQSLGRVKHRDLSTELVAFSIANSSEKPNIRVECSVWNKEELLQLKLWVEKYLEASEKEGDFAPILFDFV